MEKNTDNCNSLGCPLAESWWVSKYIDELPPDDAPILAPYEKTRPGFELLVTKTLKGKQDVGWFPANKDGYQQVCLWDIFEQNKDPAATDKEKQKINKMQQSLSKLNDNDRYIRLQIACLNRCYWTFPDNVDLVINGIVKGRPNLSAPVSCEPPWRHGILPLLRKRQGYNLAQYPRHHTESFSREEQIFLYIKILISWSVGGDLFWLKKRLPDKKSGELVETIYSYLGPSTKLKCMYIQKLCWSLSFWAFSSHSLHEERWKQWLEITNVLNDNIRTELGEKEDIIGTLIDRNNENGSCHHAFFRHVEHIIAHIGAGRPVRFSDSGRERKRIHDTIVNYVHTLGSWLIGRTPDESVSICLSSEKTIKHLYDMLGEKTLRKRWLIACLWKKLQEVQTHCGRGALDEQPERFVLPPSALEA